MNLSLVLVVLLALSPAPAAVDVPDPQEPVVYPLDVRAGTAEQRGHAVVFTLQTYAPFGDEELEQPEGEDYAVAIGVSTDGDEAFERLCFVHVGASGPYAVVTAGARRAEADLNTFSPRRRILGHAAVRRPSQDSVEVAIPTALLGGETLRWRARMVSSPEPGSIHYDYVPDEGLAREE